MFVGGTASLFDDANADGLHAYRGLLELLERRRMLLDVVAAALDSRRPFVRVGDELGNPALQQLSLVGSAYGLSTRTLGTVNDVSRLAAWAHERGAIYVCDAAQAAPHKKLDVQALGADFVAVSGHKMCAPSGIGFLWGRAELLQAMEPFLLGGHMIRKVRFDETTWGELPHKFEAGTAPMAEAVGLAAAIDYLEEIGLDAIYAHEQELAGYALERLGEIPGVTLYGPPAERRAAGERGSDLAGTQVSIFHFATAISFFSVCIAILLIMLVVWGGIIAMRK